MSFVPRPYQVESIDRGVAFFKSNKKENAFQILPTGSGKSVCIANIAGQLNEPTLIFQPSKEILKQNFEKYTSYGFRAGIYSHSAGVKHIDDVTFVTIGSVANKKHLFQHFKHVVIDECHLVNAKGGMYNEFINALHPDAKVLGLTATPYRLTANFDGAMLKFLNRTRPRIFNRCNYYIQNDVLFNAGHLSKLEYFSFDVIDRGQLEMNTSGTDFTDSSLKNYLSSIDMPKITIGYANRILSKRPNLLVFCSLISEAMKVSAGIPGSIVLTGETDQSVRDRILKQFKAGIINCVINVGVLTTGFDYPALSAVLIARSTMSLALYYQIVGRVMRPHESKPSAWVVDLGGNISFFGKIETMKIIESKTGLLSIWNGNRQLTNVNFVRQ